MKRLSEAHQIVGFKDKIPDAKSIKYDEKTISLLDCYGHKERVFNIPFLDEYDKSGKHLHTVSLYFQGGILENTFAERIYEGVKKSIEGLDNWMDVQMIYDDKDASCRVRIVFNEPE